MANGYSKYDIVEGIAAALGGRVPQFEQRMQSRREQTELALYQDAQAALNMAKRGDLQGVIDLTQDRMDILGRMGIPSDETKAVAVLAQRAMQGDSNSLQTLIGGLGDTVQRGIDLGRLARPAPPELIAYKQDENVYERDPITGALSQVVEGKKEPADYKTYEQSGITYYREGPYAGLSVGKVAELQRSGVIAQFGDPITEMPARPAPSVQIPLRPQPPQPDYSGMSQQEQAIVMQEQERQRLEDERAAAAEARLVSEEERKRIESEAEQVDAEQARQMVRDELVSALGVIDNLILKAPRNVVNAVTGPIEGAAEGASKTTYIPFGASPQEAQDLINNINFLKSLQVMSNLGRLTGVLSDSDIALLQSASSGIDRRGSPEDLIRKVNVLKDKIIEKLTTNFNMSAEEIAAMLPYAQEEEPGSFDQLLQQAGLLRAKQI
jgi:hypothetical protein